MAKNWMKETLAWIRCRHSVCCLCIKLFRDKNSYTNMGSSLVQIEKERPLHEAESESQYPLHYPCGLIFLSETADFWKDINTLIDITTSTETFFVWWYSVWLGASPPKPVKCGLLSNTLSTFVVFGFDKSLSCPYHRYIFISFFYY